MSAARAAAASVQAILAPAFPVLAIPVLAILLWAAPFLAYPAHACAPETRCEIEGGYYIAAPPPAWDGVSALPVIVYYHGWNASPEGAFRNRAMVRAAHKRGALFVAPFAPNGYWRQIGEGRAEAGRDEAAYARALMADLQARWPIDPARTLAAGFSRGASMVWNIACYEGDLFAGYAPIAGGFWRTTPRACPSGPVRLRHIHGRADRVVAFGEVGIYNSAPIPDGLSLLRAVNGCAAEPQGLARRGRLSCRRWSGCDSGRALELCLHDGGHSIPAEWVAEGLDWLDALAP